MRVYTSERVYGGSVMPPMRGAGIGSVFSKVFNAIVPFAKAVMRNPMAKRVIRDVKKAGINVVKDTLRGENVLKSTKKALRKVRDRTQARILETTRRPAARPPRRRAARPPRRPTGLARVVHTTRTLKPHRRRRGKKDLFN